VATDAPLSRPGRGAPTYRRVRVAAAAGRAVAEFVVVAATYYVAARLALRLELGGAQADAIWPPSGIAVAAVLLFGRRALGGVFAGALCASLVDVLLATNAGWGASPAGILSHAGAGPIGAAVAGLAGLGSTLEALIVAEALQRGGSGLARLDNAHDALVLVAASVVAPAASMIGVAAPAVFGLAPASSVAATWAGRWLGDTGGIVVVTPLMVAWAHSGMQSPRVVRWGETIAAMAAVAVLAAIVFAPLPAAVATYAPAVTRIVGDRASAAPYLVVPVLLWVEFRLGPATGALARAAVVAIVIAGALAGSGPFVGGSPHAALLALQSFVVVVAATMTVVGGALAERRHRFEASVRSREQLEKRVERRTAALIESEKRYRMLVEGVVDYAIFLLDPDGHVINWNVGAQRINGYSAEEIIGRHFSIFYTPDERAAGRPEATLEIATREGKFETEAWRVRKDGARFYASIVCDALREEDGRLVGFAKITRDITHQMRQKEALELARASLTQAQKMEAIGQLTGGIAHDFNNILTVIIGNLEIIQRGLTAAQDKLRDAAQSAMRGAVRAAAVTQRLLAFARRQPLEPQPIEINTLVAEMTGLLDRVLGDSVTHEIRLAESRPKCFCDANQLETALLNLVINARDAMPDGGTVTIATGEEDLAPGTETDGIVPGRYAVLRVSDTGVGMPADVRARVFEPFFTTKEVGKGSGLGLSMVYGFVKQSRGHIRVDSEPGKGTAVTLYLPRAADVRPETAAAERRPQAGDDRRGALILVVEDNAEVRQLAVAGLGALGYRVICAGDSDTALGRIAAEPGIDLLLVDLGLPRCDGSWLAAEAKRRHPQMRVLFMTGRSDEGSAAAGGDAIVLHKPFTRDELAREVARAFVAP